MRTVLLAIPLVFVTSMAFALTVDPTSSNPPPTDSTPTDPVPSNPPPSNLPPQGPATTETGPTLFLGLSWTLNKGASGAGGGAGVTLKLLSTNQRNVGAVAAGVTYHFDNSIGCDLGLAYNGTSNGSITFGWDICSGAPQISLGASGLPKTTSTPVN